MENINYDRGDSVGRITSLGMGNEMGKTAGSTLARMPEMQFSYEKYMNEIHGLIDQIEKKVRPITLDIEGSLRAEKPTFPDSGTQLESNLRAIMNRLERVNDSIIV